MTQEEALDILKLGHSVYLTGPAGSGKTYVLSRYVSFLRERGIRVAVTASTGIAATHIEGTTIHSWSGMGVKDSLTEYDLENLEQKKALWKKYEETNVLVIDEISMLSAQQLDMVDEIARHMKRREEPFGGMQVVFTGDFFQLPPINRNGDVQYAFRSRVWSEFPPVVCYLESQHRQKEVGGDFSSILENIRSGTAGEKVKKLLEKRLNKKPPKNLETTKLYTHNIDVDRINDDELASLKGKEYTFSMYTKGSRRAVEALQKGCLAPETLRLKIGARVMFVKNDPAGFYANGTLGSVVAVQNNTPRVKLNNGKVISADPVSWNSDPDGGSKAEITQVPLRLAWAITVHKSQGMTLDAAEIDLSKTFVAGQGYVALSRVRSIDGIFLSGINNRALEVSPEALSADVQFKRRSKAASLRLSLIDLGTREKMAHSCILRMGGSIDTKKIEKNKKELSDKTVKEKVPTIEVTRELLEKKLSLKEMAAARNLKEETIISHIEKLLESGQSIDITHLTPRMEYADEVIALFKKSKDKALTPVMRKLEKKDIDVTYAELRFIRLFA
ncbi:MAG: AAA family ATPase [Candidatus Paceibacterota bacterium]